MYYVINRQTWPAFEHAKTFRDFDSAQHFIDRRTRSIEAAFGEVEARRFVRNTVVFTSTRAFVWHTIRSGAWLAIFFLILLYCTLIFFVR